MIDTYRILTHLSVQTTSNEQNYHNIKSALHLWGEAFENFETEENFYQRLTKLKQTRENCVIVIDKIDEKTFKLISTLNNRYEILFIATEDTQTENLNQELFSIVNHVVSIQQGHLTTTSIISALKKIATREIFGIEKYLTYGTPLHFFVLSRSEDRPWFIERLMHYIQNLEGVIPSGTKEFARMAGEVLDEFLMNAIWDASPHRCQQDRSIPVLLPPDESIRVEWGSDGKTLAISVRDPFGTLQKDMMLKYVDEILGKKHNKNISIHKDSAGAGLGLYMVFRRLSGLVINLSPQISTEFIALFDLTRSPRHIQKGPKTFHFFSL